MTGFRVVLALALTLGLGPIIGLSPVAAQDDDSAAELAQIKKELLALCDAGDPDACLDASNIADAEALKAACAEGMPLGCYNLGARIAVGDGPLDPSPEMAVRLFARACNLGLAHGCNDLGDHFRRGEGVPQSNARAAEAYRRALAIDPAHERASASLASLPAE